MTSLGACAERLQETIEDSRIVGRKAEFDPVFTLSGLYEAMEKPQNTQEFVATQTAAAPRTSRLFDEENLRFDTALKGKTLLGTEYEFTVELNSLKNTLNIDMPPSLFYPEYESFAGLRLTQPLLRDFGPEVQLAGLRVAQTDRRLATLAWKLKVTQVVASVMKNYYDLVFASDDTVIKAENIGRARTLEDQNRSRVKNGVGSELDVQQAAVAASVREEELISAEYFQKEKANLLLRDLVADLDPSSIPMIRPRHSLGTAVPPLVRGELMSEAVAHRLEYRQAQEQIGKQEIKLKFARNQLWPRLDLIGSLGANGLNSSSGSALGDSFETSQRRLTTTRQSVAATEATLDAENKRLTQGVGVSFNILEAQKDLASATSREIAARADLNKSLVDLWLSTGTLLSRMNIILEADPDAPVFLESSASAKSIAAPAARRRAKRSSAPEPEPTVETTVDLTPGPFSDTVTEPAAEATAEPAAEATAEPTAEPVVEPAPGSSEEAVVEPIPDPEPK